MKKIIFFVFFLIFGAIFTLHIFSQEYDPDFNSSNIISNFQMFDYNSMTLNDIQAFLQIKNSYLATYSSPDFDGTIKTAAQIIYDAAQRYQVNPKYILVTLQKEQGLIQMQNPPQKRLDWACGYAVCDTCSMDDPKIQKYKGFGKQVDNAAGAMRFYFDNANVYDFIKKASTDYVIDGLSIVFQNQATANLYTYTPHISGNYTFWRVWQRYFGDPLSNTREANASIYTGYMAQVVNTADKNTLVKEGETAYFWVEYLNIGTEAWHNEDLKNLYIIDSNYKSQIPIISQTSSFTPTSSIVSNIKVYSQKTIVNPGEVLRVTIPIQATANKIDSYNYMLVLGNKGFFTDSDVNFKVTRQFKYDAELSSGMPQSVDALKKSSFTIKYKNVGTSTWSRTDVKLYMTKNRKTIPILMKETSVAPGKIATFNFSETLSKVGPNDYSFSLYKIVNSKTKNKFSGDYNISVNAKIKYGAQLVSQDVPAKMKPGEVKTVTLIFKNVGTENWDKNLVLRSYSNNKSFSKSSFYSSSWDSALAIANISGVVKNGENFTFTFKLKSPTAIGTYNQYFQLEWGKKFEEIIIDDTMSKLFKIKVSTK